MNRYLDFLGGKPDVNIDDLLWNVDSNYEAIQAIFRAFGDNYIIQGVTGTTPVTAGYVMLDGELLQVDAHAPSSTHFEKVTTYDTGGDVTFNDGVARQTWQKNRATITAGSGNLAYSGAQRGIDIPWIDLSSSLTFNSTYITSGAIEYRVLLDGTIEFRGSFDFKAAAISAFFQPFTAYTSANLFGNDRKIARKYAAFVLMSDADVTSIEGGIGRLDFDVRSSNTLQMDIDFGSALPAVGYGFFVRIPATY